MNRILLYLAVGTIATATAAFAQDAAPAAGAPPAGGGQRRQMPPPSNLKVLPAGTSSQDVIAVMRKFEGQLGVECGYCHAKDPATGRNNFASDANPIKDKARLMMKMTGTINSQFITTLTPKPENEVNCGTCHRGVAKPTVFVPKPEERPAGPPPGTPPPPGK